MKPTRKVITALIELAFFLVLALPDTQPAQAPPRDNSADTAEMSKPQILQAYGKLPLSFEANRGQTDSRAQFLVRGSGYTLFLAGSEAVLALGKPHRGSPQPVSGERAEGKGLDLEQTEKPESILLRMKFLGANPAPQVVGLEELPGKSHYFIGNDPKKWHSNIPNYAMVRYQNIYPGIDLIYRGNQRRMEYDFVLTPGADPKTIALGFEGADKLEVDARGDLVLHIAAGEVRLQRPLIYQEVKGVKQAIPGSYVLLPLPSGGGGGKRTPPVGFQVADYDASRPLVIDPVLVYSTYLAGSGEDRGIGIAVDRFGNAYVAGRTDSLDFPTVNPLQPGLAGGTDIFVTKLNAAGSALIYSTYLGGSAVDRSRDIAVDAFGNVYLTGETNSPDFPTVNPIQPAFAGGTFDAYVAKLNAIGSALIYSTYLGGSGGPFGELGLDIAVDRFGNAYVAGRTDSLDFPTVNPIQPSFAGGTLDAFVTKVNAAGTALVYSTYLGGSGEDQVFANAVDASGNAYLSGETDSPDFPITLGAFQTALPGNDDSFVTKVNAAGSALVYSTYLGGGGGNDDGVGIAVDAAGNAYVTGRTSSTDFPLVNSIQPALAGGFDAFVTKVNAAGTALVYSTYLGGSGEDNSFGGFTWGWIAVDVAGNAYATGVTTSLDFPTVKPIQPAFAGGPSDAFVTKVNAAGTALVYSTYLGGSGEENGRDIAVDRFGSTYVIGSTSSPDFPTVNPLQPTFGGGTFDAFVAKLREAPPCPIQTALEGAPGQRAALGTVYHFRDDVLAQSPEGQRYIELFYRHAREGTWLLVRHPDLRVQTRAVLARLRPTLQAVAAGQPAALTSADVEAVESLMEAFSAKASPRLQRTIGQLRSELRRGTLLSPFGIGVGASR